MLQLPAVPSRGITLAKKKTVTFYAPVGFEIVDGQTGEVIESKDGKLKTSVPHVIRTLRGQGFKECRKKEE